MLFSEMETMIMKMRLELYSVQRSIKTLEEAVSQIQIQHAKPLPKKAKKPAANVVTMRKGGLEL